MLCSPASTLSGRAGGCCDLAVPAPPVGAEAAAAGFASVGGLVEVAAAVAETAAGALAAGALTLVAAIVLALAQVMQPWLAASIVGVVLLLLGWMLLRAGQRKLADVGRLGRTQESLQKDATVVARRTS